ncbi:hypothetical protein ABEB36_008329 [Hypothenemus hampei]|uniref:Uncharacterized protein n=1 Tax=Hypothenemus hampei TaxID=57062 RepID=A0ABD1EQK1_HYPHA
MANSSSEEWVASGSESDEDEDQIEEEDIRSQISDDVEIDIQSVNEKDNAMINLRRNMDGPEWRKPTGCQPVLIPFTKPSGVNPNVSELLRGKEPIAIFLALIDDNIFK